MYIAHRRILIASFTGAAILGAYVAFSSQSRISVTSPRQNSIVSGQILLTGTSPGFANVEVSFNGILLGRATPSPTGAFVVSVSTLSLPDGVQLLAFNAWDSSAGQPYLHSTHADLNLAVANGTVNIVDFGARPDGKTDNVAAIIKAIAVAKEKNASVFVPAGTFAYGDLITLTSVRMFGVGDASILYALDWHRESIFMYGDRPEIRQLQLTGVNPPERVAPWEATRITVFGATRFVIDHVMITGSAAAGIQTATGANNGMISNNTIKNTLSDSIHITDRAAYITLQNNLVENSGDDGIAIVSYLNDGDYVSNITATNNTVRHNKWGRNMSVVGGKNIVYENNDLESNSNWACLYFAQEGGYKTYGDVNVYAKYNTLKACGNRSGSHGAVMIVTTGRGRNTNIKLIRNDIVQDGNIGIRVFGTNDSAVLEANRIFGAIPALDIESTGTTLIPYSSGEVGYTPKPADPIP